MWDNLTRDIKQIVYRYLFDINYGKVKREYSEVWINKFLDNSNEPAYYWDEGQSLFYVLGYDDNGEFDSQTAFGANYRPLHKLNMLHSYIYKFDGTYINVRLPAHYHYSLLKCEMRDILTL